MTDDAAGCAVSAGGAALPGEGSVTSPDTKGAISARGAAAPREQEDTA